MITQYEIREFRLTQPYTGRNLTDLIEANNLEDFELYEHKKEYLEPDPMMVQFNRNVYVLRFRRRMT